MGWNSLIVVKLFDLDTWMMSINDEYFNELKSYNTNGKSMRDSFPHIVSYHFLVMVIEAYVKTI